MLSLQGRPPLWAAAPQFHFLELQPQGCRAAAPSMHSYDQSPSGLAHLRWVEELPARRVDVARGELLPSGPYWAGAADQMELPLSATARLANITLNPKAEDHGAAQVEAFEF